MIIIKNGLVIDPGAGKEAELDVLIDGAVIRDIAKPGSFAGVSGAEVIDARGCWVTPGLIDIHVHLREPGFEWKETIESGTKAAVLGGFTTICCMANTRPVNDHAEITRFIIQKAAQAGRADVLPYGSISKGMQGKEMSPYSELQQAGCVGFSDDGEPVYDALLMRRALEWNRMLGLPLMCHEEDKRLCHGGCMNDSAFAARLGLHGMPAVSEEILIARDIELARAFKGRVHFCHVSTARGVELVRRAKNDGIPVTAEVTPHHLTLTEQRVGDYDTNAKMSPPLRQLEDLSALRQGLKDGTLDAVASDHAPHERDTKVVEFDRASFGTIGLQTSLPLLLGLVREGALSRQQLIERYTQGPARALNLKDRGTLREGARADITLIDPDYRWPVAREKLASLSKNSPYLGEEMQGAAKAVLVAGRPVVKEYRLEE